MEQVWLVAPPSGDARYESAKMVKRRETMELAQKAVSADANRSVTSLSLSLSLSLCVCV